MWSGKWRVYRPFVINVKQQWLIFNGNLTKELIHSIFELNPVFRGYSFQDVHVNDVSRDGGCLS